MVKRYVSGLLRAHPSLDVLIEREAAEAIWLTNGLCIEIHTCSFRSLRGYAHTFEVAERGPAQVVRDAPRARSALIRAVRVSWPVRAKLG